ncbi:MAG TPA: hypothetical protein VJZ91_03335 [Blastocatellia bacterium]|nr:hypothetical protein [Blastocatellia bacterium]
MADFALTPVAKARFRQMEFYAFSVLGFALKSYLLVRLPYRPWYVNLALTLPLLLLIYCFFRFRQNIVIPLSVVGCLAAAIALDVLGNLFQLYGHPFGPLPDYDMFTHFLGSGFSLVPVMWLLRATTRRMGVRLPQAMVGFFATTVTFSLCAWYEILELWDELFWGDNERIHGSHDTANDLQFDLAGIVCFALFASLVYVLKDRREPQPSLAE